MQSIHKKKLYMVLALSILIALLYQFAYLPLSIFDYAMKIRGAKLIVMIITAICIGGASIIFQTIINNTIVTPCLLGMNGLYILTHTVLIFILGSSSMFVKNQVISFLLDIVIMILAAMLIYGYLFKKVKGSILYILLAGTVMATLFDSITSTLQRVMDPNQYNILQNALLAGFHKSNPNVIIFALVAIVITAWCLRKELKNLNVLSLGRQQAINLGIDYDVSTRRLLIGVTVCIAIATALVGPISFLGLVIANLSRNLLRTFHHSYLIFGSIFFGVILLLGGQFFIERMLHYSTTIGVFINVGGGLYFLYLILGGTKKNGY